LPFSKTENLYPLYGNRFLNSELRVVIPGKTGVSTLIFYPKSGEEAFLITKNKENN
jgi:hypothetical protein